MEGVNPHSRELIPASALVPKQRRARLLSPRTLSRGDIVRATIGGDRRNCGVVRQIGFILDPIRRASQWLESQRSRAPRMRLAALVLLLQMPAAEQISAEEFEPKAAERQAHSTSPPDRSIESLETARSLQLECNLASSNRVHSQRPCKNVCPFPVTADFRCADDDPQARDFFGFEDLSQGGAESTFWDFGNGWTLEDPESWAICAFYPIGGTYSVCESAFDSCSQSKICREIQVLDDYVKPGLSPPTDLGKAFLIPMPFSFQGEMEALGLRSELIVNAFEDCSAYGFTVHSLKPFQDNTMTPASWMGLYANAAYRVEPARSAICADDPNAGALYLKTDLGGQPAMFAGANHGTPFARRMFLPTFLKEKALRGGGNAALFFIGPPATRATAIQIAGLSPETSSSRLQLFRSNGMLLREVVLTILPYGVISVDPFAEGDPGADDDYFLRLAVNSPNDRVFAEVLSFDRLSRDGFIAPMQPIENSTTASALLVPGARSSLDADGRAWKTALQLFNPGPEQTLTVGYWSESTCHQKTISIGEGSLVSFDDAIGELFPAVVGSTTGLLRFTGVSELLGAARCYFRGEEGELGDSLPVTKVPNSPFDPYSEMWILGLTEDPTFETSLYISELAGVETGVWLSLGDFQVNPYLPIRRYVALQPFETVVIGDLIVPDWRARRLRLRADYAAGKSILVSATVLDRESGDISIETAMVGQHYVVCDENERNNAELSARRHEAE